MTGLSPKEPHYWGEIPEVLQSFQFGPEVRVLEVGPGYNPYPRATHYVDFVDCPKVPELKFQKLDIVNQQLPFPDKHFDFVYCRQTIEDSWNPFALCAEVSRVGKAGYVETPSPIAEVTRGVDGGAPPWRGYFHHRYICWEQAGTLCFVSKYPLIEQLVDRFDSGTAGLLRQGPRYWNTYYRWDGEIKLKHLQAPLDFEITRGYANVLAAACEMSRISTDRFFEQLSLAKAA